MKTGVGYTKYKKLLDQLLHRLRGAFGADVIRSFALFGSVARGEARPDSDIDVLVVHKPVDFDPVWRFVKILSGFRESDEYRRLQAEGFSPDPYPVFMTEGEMYERPLILLDIMDHGIIIYDSGVLRKRFESLKKRLAELGTKKVVLEDGSWYWHLKPDWKPGEVIEL
jgi:predicted nucleotidyltransferase